MNSQVIFSASLSTAQVVVVMIANAWASLVLGQAPDPSQHHVDQTLFRNAYGVLDNEHLLFPLDQEDWPVRIDESRQLFLDDYLIGSSENVVREVHQARKHPRNPLVVPDKPWEGSGCIAQRVLWDEKMGKFRMWYQGHTSFELPTGVRVRSPTCYAESEDGLTWYKPELGLHEYEGSRANNIVIITGGLDGIFHEPRDSDPKRRYKGLVWHDWRDPRGVPPEGYYLFSSPDGIHWTQDRNQTVAWNQNQHQTGIGDTTLWRWDSVLKKYIGDVKILFRNPTMRCRGMMESDDLIHWSRPRMTFYPDALDEPDSQIYGHLGFVYESMWVGMIRVMRTNRCPNSYKQTPIQLTASRDGRHWTRVGKREEVLPLGRPDEWDPHYHDPCTPPILVGDQLWFYYRSVPLFAPRNTPENVARRIHRIGLATLRRDGFVSLNANENPGTIVTRPLTFQGRRLFVNAAVAKDGYLKAELRDASGKTVEPHTLDACKPVTGDVLESQISWNRAESIPNAAGEALRIVFALRNAKLYSFWLD